MLNTSQPAEGVQYIPLQLLHDSPFQPRITYTGLEDLAANVRAEGRIHSPLVVRPRLVDVCSQHAPEDGFEVVFGHRRKRAAGMAGMEAAPCIVRDMTDEEVRRAQMTENVQREAMRAIEEAMGFRQQMDADGVTADDIAERIGKSRSWVYGRLKLLNLCHEVRQALEAGDIDAEVALLVARVGHPRLQQKALGYIKGKAYDLEDGGAKSYRQVRELLNERFTLGLADAIFDPEDELLLPEVGHCLRCPKLSGNAPEFADLVAEGDRRNALQKSQDQEQDWRADHADRRRHGRTKNSGRHVCTDPDCFDAKKKAHLRNAAAKLASEGATVIEGNKARAAVDAYGKLKGSYIAVEDVKAALKRNKTPTAQLPQAVTIQNPTTGKTTQAYPREALLKAGVLDEAPTTPADRHAEARATHKLRETTAEEETARRYGLLLAVRQATQGLPMGLAELRQVTALVLNETRQETVMKALYGQSSWQLADDVATWEAPELTTLLLDCLLADNVHTNAYHLDRDEYQPAALLAKAQALGIDPATVAPVAPTPKRDPDAEDAEPSTEDSDNDNDNDDDEGEGAAA